MRKWSLLAVVIKVATPVWAQDTEIARKSVSRERYH